MNMATDDLLTQLLRLPREERARLAEEILSSLEEPDEEVARAWVQELKRRSADVAAGRSQTVEWEIAREEVKRELERRRADRLSS